MPKQPYLKKDKLIQQVKTKLPDKDTTSVEINQFLNNISYQDLFKGYQNTILKQNNGNFIKGINLDLLYQIHWLDLSLSEILLKLSLETEKHLKVQLANIIYGYGKDYPDYLHFRYYKNTSNKVLDKVKDFVDLDSEHYFNKARESFNGCIPSWYVIYHLSLGQVINWYSILKPPAKKLMVNSFFDTDVRINLSDADQKQLLKTFSDYILEVRNKTAHGNKIAGIRLNTNLQNRLIKQTPFSKYFEKNDSNVILSNIYNFFVIIIVLSKLEPFYINAVQTVVNYFKYNSSKENNPLSSLNITVYDLYGINHNKLNNLVKMVKHKHYLD